MKENLSRSATNRLPPKLISFGPRVKYVVKIIEDLRDVDDKPVWGQVDEDVAIELEKNAPSKDMRETMFHELIHAVHLYLGESKITEDQVARQANFLYDVLLGNPALVDYLFTKRKHR